MFNIFCGYDFLISQSINISSSQKYCLSEQRFEKKNVLNQFITEFNLCFFNIHFTLQLSLGINCTHKNERRPHSPLTLSTVHNNGGTITRPQLFS